MEKILEEYIENLKFGKKSPETIRSYEKDIRKLVSFFSIENLDGLNSLTVGDYQRFYREVNLSPVSLNGLIRNLSAFFNYLTATGIIEDNAFFKVRFGTKKSVKVSRVQKDTLTPEEEDLVIAAGRNLQEKFMLALALKTALRRGEIGTIRMEDINGCEVKIVSKGGDETSHTYLDKELCAMMHEYVAKERDTESEYLFYGTRGNKGKRNISGTAINNRVISACKRAGITKKITAHRLRATRITNIAYKHGNRAAQAIARHKNPQTTNLYVNENNEAVRDILLGEK
jgi:integrase